jgi:hypothetical protein
MGLEQLGALIDGNREGCELCYVAAPLLQHYAAKLSRESNPKLS